MTLNLVALVLLIIIVALVVYGAIGVWGIPYEIAKRRDHPHRDAIGAATWVSLFTLGALWPFLWIWAMAYRPDRGWGLTAAAPSPAEPASSAALAALEQRISALERASAQR